MVRPSFPAAQTETTDSTPVPTPVEAVPAGPDPFTDGQPSEPPVVRTVPGTLPARADFTPKELEAYELMNDPLRAKVLEIRDCMNAEARDILESRYALGSLIVEIHQHPEVYDHMSDIQMAAFFGDGGKTIYAEARRIRERYSPEEFQQILTARNPNTGGRVHYRHLACLLPIEDKAEADKALNLCLSQNWTTRQFEDFIKTSTRGGGKARTGGRRITRPASFMGFLERRALRVGGVRPHLQEGVRQRLGRTQGIRERAGRKEDGRHAETGPKSRRGPQEGSRGQPEVGRGLRGGGAGHRGPCPSAAWRTAQPTTPSNDGVAAEREPQEAQGGA